MAEVTINLSDYKASGVYYIEVDNSIKTSADTQNALRLAVGYNEKGPFNRPIYVKGSSDCDTLFGKVDRKLERKGCFTNRNIRTMVSKAPVYALNLMPVDMRDTFDNVDVVGVAGLSIDYEKDNVKFKTPYFGMFERSRFWVADENEMVKTVWNSKDSSTGSLRFVSELQSPIMDIGNCGTEDISVIIRKAENTVGYNVTFADWYGTEDDIPYGWIDSRDYVSDYFIQVVAIKGNWSEQYASLASDSVWGEFFTADGLRKEKFAKFLRMDGVTVLGNWTGCIIPDFYDKQGRLQSIEYKINSNANSTGLLFGLNINSMESIRYDSEATEDPIRNRYYIDRYGVGERSEGDPDASFIPDFVGNLMSIDPSTDASNGYDFLSYHISNDSYNECVFSANGERDASIPTMFSVSDASYADNISVGDYVRNYNGTMSKIIKKRVYADPSTEGAKRFEYTCIAPLPNSTTFEFHKSHQEMYDTLKFIPVDGLKITNKHRPGFDSDGNINFEEGIRKIYAMLENEGIRKGLLNKNMINYRYIVDTMGYGLKDKCGAKSILTKLAYDKKRTTAICNLPSIGQFASSDAPFFGETYEPTVDARPILDISYIPKGGNMDMTYSNDTEQFGLPGEEYGSKYSSFFSPYLKYSEGSRTILVPPAADISNVFMNKYLGGDPYKTNANLNGVIENSSVVGVEYMFDEDDRGELETFGVNPIINNNGTVMIYGDRTAYQDTNSDLNYLHTREIMNTIEIECGNVLEDYVFTYNNATTRAEIARRIKPILSAMQDSEAIIKYEIQIDENNNTKEIIDSKFCFVDIGVWITQNMEKVICRVTLNRSSEAL